MQKEQKLPANRDLAHRGLRRVAKHWELYLMFLPVVVWYIIFCYVPMGGVVIAFKKYSVIKGIWGSPWVGMKNFEMMFDAPMFWRALRNTLVLSGLNLLFCFPAPILFALLVNEISNRRFKSFVQTVSYLPHFISWSVTGGLVYMLLSMNTGAINNLVVALGGDAINYMGTAKYFRNIVTISSVWKTLGWSAIVYLAAITGVDEQLYEAAYIDGANRFQRIWHITLPGIRATISVLLIMQVGSLLNNNFDQIFILINETVQSMGETLEYYIYRVGLVNTQSISMGTAVGLMKSLVGMILVILTNIVSKKLTDGEGAIW